MSSPTRFTQTRRKFMKGALLMAMLPAQSALSQSGPSERDVDVNGIRLHIAEQGTGPLVILCHGWPEAWYTWDKQIVALANAGYRVVAPDMRGYGGSSAPDSVEDYNIIDIVGDMVGLVTALGESKAIIVGHDWGATVAWTAALLRPDMFPAVAGISVPYRARGPVSPLEVLKKAGLEDFYWFYFQKPGVAEAEFEKDVPATFRRFAAGPGGSLILKPGHGFLENFPAPEKLPDWFPENELQRYVETYRKTGFRGGLNWYRNFDRNWRLLAPWQNVTIRQPALFIAGSADAVISGATGKGALEQMPKLLPGLRGKVIIDGAGHFVHLERSAEVNDALISFLRGLG